MKRHPTRGVKRTCPRYSNKRALVHSTDRLYYPTAFKCRGCGFVWKVGAK